MQDEKAYFPEITLTDDERAQLMQTITTPGQVVFNKIFKSVVNGYTTYLLNTPENDKDLLFARFLMSKVAAQLFTSLVNHVNSEIATYKEYMAQHKSNTPSDDTEGVLDIGERPSTPDDVERDESLDLLIEGGV